MSYDDKELCSRMNIDFFSSHCYGNIGVHIEPVQKPKGVVVQQILVHSYSGDYNQGSILNLLKTPLRSERPDLWHQHLGVNHNLLQVLGLHKAGKSGHLKATHDGHISSDNEEPDEEILNIRSNIVDESDHSPDWPPDISPDDTSECVSSTEIRNVLLGSHKSVLEDILIILLSSESHHKWSNYDCVEFYDFALSSTAALYNAMTNHDLDIVITVLRKWECCQCPLGIKLNVSKLQKVNQMGFILGHMDSIIPKRAHLKMKSLQELATDELKRSVPVEVLRVAAAQFHFCIVLPLWLEDKCPLPISYEIPFEPHTFDVFSYPEYNVTCQQVEARIIDPSHVLTNLRVHATEKGILGCDTKAFLRVSDVDNNVLSRGLLIADPILDQQSVPFACRIFSTNVQEIMEKNSDVKEANMVKMIRNWYNACNECSISVTDRLKYLIDMHNFLMKFYHPEHFPMNTSYIKHLPSTTFQSIMHNISTRLHLYHLSEAKTYNHCSVSTLAIESLFSNLASLAANTNGVPMATNIPKHISRMTLLNAAKNNPSKYGTNLIKV